MNEQLKAFLERYYPNAKRNLYSAFVERALELLDEKGRLGILTGQTFMFISSFEQFRKEILREHVIENLAQFDYGLFKARVDTTAFVLRREPDAQRRNHHTGIYFRLVHEPDSDAKRLVFEKALSELRQIR
jgi:hypothetical protein